MGSREIAQNFFFPEFWAKAFQGVLEAIFYVVLIIYFLNCGL